MKTLKLIITLALAVFIIRAFILNSWASSLYRSSQVHYENSVDASMIRNTWKAEKEWQIGEELYQAADSLHYRIWHFKAKTK